MIQVSVMIFQKLQEKNENLLILRQKNLLNFDSFSITKNVHFEHITEK